MKLILGCLNFRCKVYVYPIVHNHLSADTGVFIRTSKSVSVNDVIHAMDPFLFHKITVIQDLTFFECLFKKKRGYILNYPLVILPSSEKYDPHEEYLDRISVDSEGDSCEVCLNIHCTPNKPGEGVCSSFIRKKKKD